jgi:hypothetical protein
MFRKLDLFPSSGERETPALLGHLERAMLSHGATHVKVQVKFEVTLRLDAYSQSVLLGHKPLELHDQRFFN